MIKTFVFKLYHSKKNKILHKQIDVAAEIYNYCIDAHQQNYKLYGKIRNKYDLQKELTKAKKLEENGSWKPVGSQSIQDITDRIDRSYTLFFKNLRARKNGRTKRIVRPPSYKKASKYKSITYKQSGYALLEGNRIRIGKTIFKYSKSRELEGIIKTVTVKRNRLGELFVIFCCEVPDSQINRTMTGKIAGFDFGLKTFLTSSEGLAIKAPLFNKQAQNLIAQANRNFSRKQKGSANRLLALIEYARVHIKIANKRKDYLFKLARKLAKEYDVLCFEDLNIAAMQKLWGKKIGDLGFNEFIRILKYVCSQTGSTLCIIDRFYPSSKQCSHCLEIKEDLSLKDRVWRCDHCQTIHDRDKNAAINIFREGASSLGLGNVRPPLMAISV